MIRQRHGRELEELWQGTFGHGAACLTNVEAGYLCRVKSVAAVEMVYLSFSSSRIRSLTIVTLLELEFSVFSRMTFPINLYFPSI
jgi:hypothetical protein